MNAGVVGDWIKGTTPFEWVYRIVRRTYEPQSVNEIADRARVPLSSAQKHLPILLEMREVTSLQASQTTLYRRADTATSLDHARQLHTSHITDELTEGIVDMKASIRELHEEFGVETPEELACELDIIQRPGFCSGSDRACTAWLTTCQNLALTQVALTISEADRTGRHSRMNDDRCGDSPDTSVFCACDDVDDVPSEVDEDFGPIDAGALYEIRDVFTETEPLVASTQLDNSLNPQTLHVELSDGIGDATSARFDVPVNLANDYAFHHTDDGSKEVSVRLPP